MLCVPRGLYEYSFSPISRLGTSSTIELHCVAWFHNGTRRDDDTLRGEPSFKWSANGLTFTSILMAYNTNKTSPFVIMAPFCVLTLDMLACMCV